MNPTPSDQAEAPRYANSPAELPPVEAPTAGFILQLFVIPAIIVVVVVVVWLLFGKLASGEKDAMSYVETIKSPSAHWRAAFELTSLIKNSPQLASDPKLLGELAETLDQDLKLKTDEKLLQWLTSTLGTFQTLDGTTASGQKVDVVAVLCHALEYPSSDEVKLAAAASIAQHAARMEGKFNDPRAVKALVETKSANSPAVRKLAAFALGFMNGDDATAGLKVLINDSNRDVRYNAALALARRDDNAALGFMREMLSDKDLQTLYTQDTPEEERKEIPSKIEAVELEALNALNYAIGVGKKSLATTLKPEIESLGRSGLVSVRSRALEVLNSLQNSK